MASSTLPLRPVVTLLVLAMVWGANMAFVKLAQRQVTPLFMCGIRSLVATICLYLWMKYKREKIFPSKVLAWHGAVVGLLFGGEFAFIYVALKFTTASSTYILLYTAPFFAAIGAHVCLKGDRLSINKLLGLIIAFLGVAILLRGSLKFVWSTLKGDVFALTGGFLWGMTSVYVKRFLADKAKPTQVLFYQLYFSTPLLFAMSFLLEENYIMGFSSLTLYSILYQSIVVAFISYLCWFRLINSYQVSILHAFSFFTPVFGVIISGILMLKEPLRLNTLVALIMVSIGTMISNMPSKRKRH